MKASWSRLTDHDGTYIEPLTRREREILVLMSGDLTHKEIADRLTLAPTSVKWYVQQIYHKLGVNSRRQAVLRGKEIGWLEKPSLQEKPTGYVTFLFTDIEGSTRLWETVPQAMQASFQKQEKILRDLFLRNHGFVYKMIGDAFQVAFSRASQAVSAAIEVQRKLMEEDWGDAPVRIRMALHTCFTEERSDDYVGPELNRVARLLSCGHGGQVLITQATMDALGGDLPQAVTFRDHGRRRLKDIIEPEHIYQLTAPGLQSDFPELRTQNTRLFNLRLQQIPFVGRQKENTDILNMMSPENSETRLLTLTGPGGVGKTRAALQAATSLVDRYVDGVYFCELAAVNSIPGIIEVVAHSLNLQLSNSDGGLFTKESAWEQLVNFLSARELLIILDNFEHLVHFSSLVSELIDSTRSIKIIVTSRIRLNLVGEWVYPLEGLPYPGKPDGHDLRAYPSIQLFLDCAKMSGISHLQDKDLPQVARICQMVEGLPLAIQLAASWVKLYSLQEIADEINQNLDFLQQTQQGVPDRHQTIRAVFNHSWELLSATECDALECLAVFEGGFTLSEALAVTQSSNMVLSSLMDKSLIRRHANGRFSIHEILKQYAMEKLRQDPELLTESQSRHAAYFSSWVEQMGVKLRGAEQETVQSALRFESQNLRLAWDWLLTHEDFDTIRKLLDSIILLFDIFGPSRKGIEFLEPLLERLRARQKSDEAFLFDDLLAFTLAGLGYFLTVNSQAAASYIAESFEVIRHLPVNPVKAYTYLLLLARPGAYLDQIQQPGLSNYDKLMFLSQETLAIFEENNDQWGIALTLLIRGDCMNAGIANYQESMQVYQRSLALFKQTANLWGQALCYHGMALADRREGRYAEAVAVNKNAVEIYQKYENYDRLIAVRHTSAEIYELMGDIENARAYYQANLDYYDHIGNREARSFYQARLDRLSQ